MWEKPKSFSYQEQLVGGTTLLRVSFSGKINVREVNAELRLLVESIDGPKNVFFDLGNINELGITSPDIASGLFAASDGIEVVKNKQIKLIAFSTGGNPAYLVNHGIRVGVAIFGRLSEQGNFRFSIS